MPIADRLRWGREACANEQQEIVFIRLCASRIFERSPRLAHAA
jgi:hypothetical protein